MPEDLKHSEEVLLYEGRHNSIYMTREYFQEYSCQFNLYYYPFDTQVCKIEFKVQGKTEEFVKLVQDGRGVEFESRVDLVEYKIQMQDLKILTSKDDISVAQVRVVFQRKMEYHVANTFLQVGNLKLKQSQNSMKCPLLLQTFVIMMVGYLSFYFEIDDFNDRIMVSLTTLLVVATMTSSIQAVRVPLLNLI